MRDAGLSEKELKIMQFDWPYYTFNGAQLIDEDGAVAFSKTFNSASEAEQWLVDEDIRGSVQ